MCGISNEENTDSNLNPYENAMLNDFEVYNFNTESVYIEKCSILSMKVEYIEHNRKALIVNRVKVYPILSRCLEQYSQIIGKDRSCREFDFDNITVQPLTHCNVPKVLYNRKYNIWVTSFCCPTGQLPSGWKENVLTYDFILKISFFIILMNK